MNSTSSDYRSFVADVEAENGIPLVFSEFGFKKVEVSEKKYLAPMSIDEAAELVSRVKRIPLSEAKSLVERRWCLGGGQTSECITSPTCPRCRAVWDYAGWTCLCPE